MSRDAHNTAKHVESISVKDPDTQGDVHLALFKHSSGGMFAIDESFIDQTFDDEEVPLIQDPFDERCMCMLLDC